MAEYNIKITMPEELVDSGYKINWKLVISLVIVLFVLLVIIFVSKLRMKNIPNDNKDDVLQNGSLSTHGVQPITDNNFSNSNGFVQPQVVVQSTPVNVQPTPVNVQPQPVNQNQPQQVVVQTVNTNPNVKTVVVNTQPLNTQSNSVDSTDNNDIEMPTKKDDNIM